VNVPQAIEAWASPKATVVPKEALYPPDVSREEMDATAQQQMSRSQHDATIMALDQLGIDVPVQVSVAGVDVESCAYGLLEEGDRIEAVATPQDGRIAIEIYPDLASTLANTPPGTTVSVYFERDGETREVSFDTLDDGYGGSMLGIFLDPEFDMPFDVDIELEKVGGPSAGTMFALGIMDLLTPEPLVGDHVVAGTGTINLNGRIGPIGGIKQKMFGAHRDGAEFFLAPAENCSEVRGNVPRGLHVVRVDTLDDAVEAVGHIRDGSVSSLPEC
ncbi:MAG TPA: S16 family serine protease, partial [Beutenbergiaceae bacterium]|nr:S16 family serine protease [Beutenbergiaceae bacterium]